MYIGYGKRVKSLAGRNKAVDIDYVRANANVITITRRQRRDQNGTSGGAAADQHHSIYSPTAGVAGISMLAILRYQAQDKSVVFNA